MRLATGPVTWGVDFAGAPGNPPWEEVLDAIAASGIGALELGPVGYLPEDPATLRAELRRRRLTAVGSFVFEDLHDPGAAARVLATARRAARAIAAAGGRVLVIIDRPSPERTATAGRAHAAARLDPRRWATLVELTAHVAAIARDAGLVPVVHPHAGSFVEFRDEVDRLLAATDVGLCLDTGHCAYAGVDPVELIEAHAHRIRHVHLKDVDPAVRARRLDLWTAIAAGVFCPLGDGAVDLEAVLHALARHGYRGYATIEQDRSAAPLDDLRRSVAVVAAAGV